MNKVFVVQQLMKRDASGTMQPMYDLSPAARFGALVPLLDSQRIPLMTGSVMRDLHAALSNYRDGDFILPIGDPVAIGAATMVAAHHNEGRVTLLRYMKNVNEYVPVTLVLLPNRFHTDAYKRTFDNGER